MSLRDLVLSRESETSFIISESEKYENSGIFARFKVHGPVNDKYIVSLNEIGELGTVEILGIMDYFEEAIDLAYIEAKKYVTKNLSIGVKYEDRTGFKFKD